jgi:hypothetical protein
MYWRTSGGDGGRRRAQCVFVETLQTVTRSLSYIVIAIIITVLALANIRINNYCVWYCRLNLLKQFVVSQEPRQTCSPIPQVVPVGSSSAFVF